MAEKANKRIIDDFYRNYLKGETFTKSELSMVLALSDSISSPRHKRKIVSIVKGLMKELG